MPGFFSRNIHLTSKTFVSRDGFSSSTPYEQYRLVEGRMIRSSGGSSDSASSTESTGINNRHKKVSNPFSSNRQLLSTRLSSSQRNDDLSALSSKQDQIENDLPITDHRSIEHVQKNVQRVDDNDDWGYFVDFRSPLAEEMKRKSFIAREGERLTPHPE
jgi:hypothetical protein